MSEVSYRAVVDTALSQVGYQGTSNTSKYSADLDAVKFYNYPKNGAASWCAIFYDWCVWMNTPDKDVNYARSILCEPNVDNCGAGCTQKVQYYKNAGRWYSKSKDATTGDEIFFKKSNGQVYHTGIVVDWDNNGFYVVEGNTNGNKVAKKYYTFGDSKIAGFGRPDWYKYQEAAPKPTPEPTPAPAPTPAPVVYDKYKVTTNGSTLTLRGKPNTSSTNLANIPNGTTLEVTEIVQGEPIKNNTNWGKTTYNGKPGYVSLRWCTKI